MDSKLCPEIIASYPQIEGTLPIEDKDVEYMVNHPDCEVEVIMESDYFYEGIQSSHKVFKTQPKTTNGFITLKFKEKEVEEKKWTEFNLEEFIMIIGSYVEEGKSNYEINEIVKKEYKVQRVTNRI